MSSVYKSKNRTFPEPCESTCQC